MKKAVGIDIGGTKIAAGVISDTGVLLERAEVKSDPLDREKMFGRVVEAVEQVLRKSSISIANIEGIGVGVPGKVDRAKGIAIFQNNLPWRQFPITFRLQEQFGIERITIDNDVYTAAFAEWKAAQGKKDETFVYVTISTGISCSIIHKGSFFRGAGFAGELGLIPAFSKGTNNRLEKVAAGPGIQRIAERDLQVDTISTKDVFAGYINGVQEYQSIINEVTDYLAQGLYTISCLLDPHKMTFGGSVIVKNPFLLELIKEKLKIYQLPEQQHLLDQMSISTLAQHNGVIGAGLRVFEDMY
ncbi:ROK family protein [Bacillus cereus]|uniref:ROK family protein n=1 Tax=Bacillus cereus group TaxID=86661 RepID=UPI0001A0352A|nr:ROK family protein [Bacillus cereus]EEK79327.1 glucokinase [Bacillus cereus R309803]PFW58854.1 ROK family protein [Bacillus cereus]PGZ64652.1 ROK family protein [Bacillus cereus]HDR4561304.1 ROK family protein [Bacillus luti]